MRRMTCHGVCNLEACFFGGRSPWLVEITRVAHQNWWKYTFKKTRPHNAASSVLIHDEVGLDCPSVSHVLVCLIDFIQLIAVREDLARIDLTVKDRLQQDFLVIGRH